MVCGALDSPFWFAHASARGESDIESEAGDIVNSDGQAELVPLRYHILGPKVTATPAISLPTPSERASCRSSNTPVF